MRTLNLGILAHIDAGKTSLTERLLFAAGVIDKPGSVDDGNTQTDSLALERQRGITIKSAVVSFTLNGTAINLIDTPGHPDFIAEVERVLSVLDGAILVISAVEGVQAQTRVLMRALKRLKIPFLIFVNKIDRTGARHESLLREITEKLTPGIMAMGAPLQIGTKGAGFETFTAGNDGFRTRLAEQLADHDDAVLEAWLENPAAVTDHRLVSSLAEQTGAGLVHPVYFGSAITGAGMDALTGAITALLPVADNDGDGPLSGQVFKVERGPAGQKLAYFRLFRGTLHTRDRLSLGGKASRVTAIGTFARGANGRTNSLGAGQIGKLWGLNHVRIGDTIGDAHHAVRHSFAPPTLETVIEPEHPSDRQALHAALAQLAEQDPLINLRQDDVAQQIHVSLFGEVQKQVIEQTLSSEFGIAATCKESSVICIERVTGHGSAAEFKYTPPNPFIATVGLRIDPAEEDSGVSFKLEVELGSVLLAFHRAIEETVRETLAEGLFGWQVTDCTVTLTHTGYDSVNSTAGDFRALTPLVLMDALKLAGTRVCEPVHHFQLDLPAERLSHIWPALTEVGAIPGTPQIVGEACSMEGEIPAAGIHGLQQQLPMLTHGEGVLECSFARYRPMRGTAPVRPRTDNNPLNRKEYLLRIAGRG